MPDSKNIFILKGFILLVTTLLIVMFIHTLPADSRCPNCHSREFIEYEETIECTHCGLKFFKDFLGNEIDEENILSDQELEGIFDSFPELKDEKARERFLKSIEKDLEDLHE